MSQSDYSNPTPGSKSRGKALPDPYGVRWAVWRLGEDLERGHCASQRNFADCKYRRPRTLVFGRLLNLFARLFSEVVYDVICWSRSLEWMVHVRGAADKVRYKNSLGRNLGLLEA